MFSNVSKVKSSFRTNWSKEEHLKMSHTFMKAGSSPRDVEKAASSVGRRLYFAGDYANFEFLGTATGAYLSGISAAN